MSANRPDVDAIEHDLVDALNTLRDLVPHTEDGDTVEEHCILAVECFCKVALEVFRKVPQNRIRAAARHFELRERLNGAEVLNLTKARMETDFALPDPLKEVGT